ncbi:hypothetical protein PQX77_020866 [Marasmius sp. AFHP31]|nr:hypothetical protein PQX77_020866 [Marasmius sp. AFHP31]
MEKLQLTEELFYTLQNWLLAPKNTMMVPPKTQTHLSRVSKVQTNAPGVNETASDSDLGGRTVGEDGIMETIGDEQAVVSDSGRPAAPVDTGREHLQHEDLNVSTTPFSLSQEIAESTRVDEEPVVEDELQYPPFDFEHLGAKDIKASQINSSLSRLYTLTSTEQSHVIKNELQKIMDSTRMPVVEDELQYPPFDFEHLGAKDIKTAAEAHVVKDEPQEDEVEYPPLAIDIMDVERHIYNNTAEVFFGTMTREELLSAFDESAQMLGRIMDQYRVTD